MGRGALCTPHRSDGGVHLNPIPMNHSLTRYLLAAVCLATAGPGFTQVTQDFSFADDDASISFSGELDPCQPPLEIDVRTTRTDGTTPVSHGRWGTAMMIPYDALNDGTTAILITIHFSAPVQDPRVAVTDIDFLSGNGSSTPPFDQLPHEWLSNMNTGFSLPITQFSPFGMPGSATLTAITPTIGQNAACWLSWTGNFTTISFVYNRVGSDLGIQLEQLQFEYPELPCTDMEMSMTTDGNGTAMRWEIRRPGCATPLVSFSDYGDDTECNSNTFCLPDGDYELEVFNDNGGTFTGSYVLSSIAGGNLVINPDGFSGTSTTVPFSLPLGPLRIHPDCRDRQDMREPYGGRPFGDQILLQAPPAGHGPDYFWLVTDPDNGDQITIETPGVGTLTNRIYYNDLFNAGFDRGHIYYIQPATTEEGPFGPATTFRLIDPPEGADPYEDMDCPYVTLQDMPGGVEHSCDVVVEPDGQLFANWTRNYARYRFEFTCVSGCGGNFTVTNAAVNNAATNRVISVANHSQLVPGSAWMVRVSVCENVPQWCPRGPCCRVMIADEFSGGGENLAPTTASTTAPTFTVWPNPNDGNEVIMDLSDATGRDVSIAIFDVMGRSMFTRVLPNDGTVDLTNYRVAASLKPGMHIVRITSGGLDHPVPLLVQ